MACSRVPCQSTRSRASTWSKARLSAPDGQSRTARTSSSIRAPLGATNGSSLVRNAVASRSVHRPGVLADAPVVEDRDLLPRVGVALVGHPLGVLVVGEAAGRVRSVAERLGRRGAAPAQRDLRGQGEPLPERGAHGRDVGDQVGAVLGGDDAGRQVTQLIGQGGEPGGAFAGRDLVDGQVLQGGGRLEQAGRRGPAEPGAQPGGEQRRVPQRAGASEAGGLGALGWSVAAGAGGCGGAGGRDSVRGRRTLLTRRARVGGLPWLARTTG